MNSVIYYCKSHKKINGSLFYAFEYYAFIKQYVPDLTLVLLNCDDEDLQMYKYIFSEKYYTGDLLDDILISVKYLDFLKYNIENALSVDVHTYEKITDLLGRTNHMRVYSDEPHMLLDKKGNHTFYGWYKYQNFNIKARLLFFKELHRTYPEKGDKIFVTSLNSDNNFILKQLGLKKNEAFVKHLNKHNENLFESINRIVYWHGATRDTNNRPVVEAYIHDVPLEIYYNGWFNDSIYERALTLAENGLDEFLMTPEDPFIKDFINDCKNG